MLIGTGERVSLGSYLDRYKPARSVSTPVNHPPCVQRTFFNLRSTNFR